MAHKISFFSKFCAGTCLRIKHIFVAECEGIVFLTSMTFKVQKMLSLGNKLIKVRIPILYKPYIILNMSPV